MRPRGATWKNKQVETKWKENTTTKQNISKNKQTATTHTKSNEIKGFKGGYTLKKTKQNNRQI